MASSMTLPQLNNADAHIEKTTSLGGRSDATVQAMVPAPPPSAPAAQVNASHPLPLRSQTMPALTPDARLPAVSKEKPSLTIDPSKALNADNDDTKSSICLSPSWDQGKKAKKEKKQAEKERKRQEEARKEAEKKAKKEAEKQRAAANKAGKRDGRLNKKPPPAAMDTQRMPSELRPNAGSRRNSILSVLSSNHSSGDSSRRSSRELKRLSVASTGSSRGQRRSQSTPASSTEIEDSSSEWRPVVSGFAPQLPALPRFGLHSRDGSSAGSKSNSWGSEEGYSRELSRYANQLNYGSTSPQQLSFTEDETQAPQSRRSLIRSQTDTVLMTVGQEQPVIKEVSRAVAERKGPNDTHRGRGNGMPKISQHSEIDAMNKSHGDHTPLKDRSYLEKAQHHSIHPLQANPVQLMSSPDGGSYVHKERMRKQQQSLRGYNDEEAIRDATRMLEDENEPYSQEPMVASPETKEPSFSSADVEEVPTIPLIPPAQEPNSTTKLSEQHRGYLKESLDVRDRVVLGNPDSMPAKKHTFLGMGFRSKPVKQNINPVMVEGEPRSAEEPRSARPSQPPRLNTNGARESTHSSTAEPVHGQAPPQSPPSRTSARRSRLSQTQVDKERSPTGKSNSPIQGRTKLANAIVDKESPPRRKEPSLVQSRSRTSHDLTTQGLQDQNPTLVQTHSRTRTSSSQLLNDNESLPRSLPRSTTAPVLPTFNPEPFDLTHDETTQPRLSKIQQAQQAKDYTSSNRPRSKDAASEEEIQQPRRPAQAAEQKADKKPVPELVIESITPEGIVRKTSLKRPRSNPQLQVTTPNPPVPSLDFLPQLKHQALVKPKPRSHLRNSVVPNEGAARPSSSQFPVPAAPMHNALPPASNSAPNLAVTSSRSHNRPISQLTSRSSASDTLNAQHVLVPSNRMSIGGRLRGLEKTVAKIIVTCCSCTRWIDLPSDLFEAMTLPARLTKLDGSAAGQGEARLDTAVQCPWCAHCMTSHCCSTDTWVCNKQQQLL